MPSKFPVPGADTHYYIFEVDAGGFHEDANDDGKTIVPDLAALLSSPTSAYTDVVVFSHGYNTQRSSPGGPLPIANNVFSAMHAVRPANCNPLYVAIFWPSSLHTMHHEAEDDNRMRFENIMKVLRGELSNALDSLSPAAETAMDAADDLKNALSTTAGMLAKETRVSGAADCLLDDTEAADVPGSKAAVDARDASLESKLEKVAEADSKAAPLEQGLPEPEAKRRRTLFYLAQDIVFGQFERRASIVGSRGVHVLLASLMKAAKEHVRFHLFGHSLGCHVVCSAAIGRAPGNVLNRKVHTLFMAQGAMESSVFSKGGPYRPIVSTLKPVAGPIVLTTSPFDSALKAYDVFHSSPVGVVGVENTDPFPVRSIPLEKQGGADQQVFNFNKETFHVLDGRNVITAADGSLFTGGSHSDIMDAETMHAFWQAASVKLRSEDMQVTSRSALPDGYWTKYRVRAENDWRPWSYCSLM